MKREEVREIFPSATDEEIDSILNKFSSELNPVKKQLKDANDAKDKAFSDLVAANNKNESLQADLDAANKKISDSMTDEERIAAREAEAARREQEFLMKSNALEAKSIFVESGFFAAEELQSLIDQVTTSDVEKTKSSAKALVDMVSKQRAAVEEATKNELLKNNPHPEGAGGNTPTTIKEFLALPLDQQLQLKESNPSILRELK